MSSTVRVCGQSVRLKSFLVFGCTERDGTTPVLLLFTSQNGVPARGSSIMLKKSPRAACSKFKQGAPAGVIVHELLDWTFSAQP